MTSTSSRWQAGTRRNKRFKRAAARLSRRYRPAPPALIWLSITEAATRIGWSRTTMVNRIKDGAFPVRGTGRTREVGLRADIWSAP